MHSTLNRLKAVAICTCSFAYWLFHAITSEQKGLSTIHELKIKKSLSYTRMYMYLDSSVEKNDVAEKVITDRHTGQVP